MLIDLNWCQMIRCFFVLPNMCVNVSLLVPWTFRINRPQGEFVDLGDSPNPQIRSDIVDIGCCQWDQAGSPFDSYPCIFKTPMIGTIRRPPARPLATRTMSQRLWQLNALTWPFARRHPFRVRHAVAFLLLLQCACPGPITSCASFRLPKPTHSHRRTIPPSPRALPASITEGTPLPLPAQQRARLALAAGGLGLRSAHASRQAAYWASWANSLPAIHRRLPAAADRILHLLRGEVRPLPPAVIEATQATHALRAHGFQPPRGTPSPCRPPATPPPWRWRLPPWVQRLASTAQDRNDLLMLVCCPCCPLMLRFYS